MRYTLYDETTRTSSTFYRDESGEGVILETVHVPDEIEVLAMMREDD